MENDNFFSDINVLSFAGGGYKTVCFLGALTYLFITKKIEMDKIEILQGSSAGCLIALALSIGIKPNTLMKVFVYELNIMNEFRKEINIKKILQKEFKGVFNGDFLLKRLSILLKKQFDKWHDTMTFEELFQLTNKKLIITATNVTQKKIVHFHFENYPKLPVLLALRMSIAIPVVFKAYKFENDFYVDGDIYDYMQSFRKKLNIASCKKILRFKQRKIIDDDVVYTNTNDINAFGIIREMFEFYKDELKHKEILKEINNDKKLILLHLEVGKKGLKNILEFDEKNFFYLFMSGIYQVQNFDININNKLTDFVTHF